MSKQTGFRIGHPAYPRNGMNRAAWHTTYGAALADLLSRRVPMRDAHQALRQAATGSLACASRYYKGTRVGCCEVLAD